MQKKSDPIIQPGIPISTGKQMRPLSLRLSFPHFKSSFWPGFYLLLHDRHTKTGRDNLLKSNQNDKIWCHNKRWRFCPKVGNKRTTKTNCTNFKTTFYTTIYREFFDLPSLWIIQQNHTPNNNSHLIIKLIMRFYCSLIESDTFLLITLLPSCTSFTLLG